MSLFTDPNLPPEEKARLFQLAAFLLSPKASK